MPPMLDDWKVAKKDFEKMTGKHKPGPKFLLVFHKSTGLEVALKECDKQAATVPIDPVKLSTALVKLQTTSATYLTSLTTARAAETGANNGSASPLAHSITALKQTLKKYMLHFEAELERANILARAAATPTTGDREEQRDKVNRTVEIRTYQTKVKAALAHAKASAEKLKALALKLDANKVKLATALKFYNEIITDKQAAVKLTQALDAYQRIWSLGGKDHSLTDPETYINSLDAYVGRSLPADTTKDDLIARIHDFDGKVKAIAQEFK